MTKCRAETGMEGQVLYLAGRGLTLKELRRRVGGRGTESLRMTFVGRAFDVSPTFGATVERLAFSGLIRLVNGRGKVRVVPGRNYGKVW